MHVPAYFVTWRLHDSVPVEEVAEILTAEGPKFVAFDQLLDAVSTGPRWLEKPEIARVVIDALRNESRLELGAWVIMPNHVHAIIRPLQDLATVIRAIKGPTARQANQILNLRGPFWARAYFERRIRDRQQVSKINRYIERNPVKAGLCADPEEWRWSSAAEAAGTECAILRA